jgi:HK97 gp10 family phage protein
VAGSVKVFVQVRGVRETQRALERAHADIRARVSKAVEETAREVVAGARSRVPVKTGELRNTIRAEPSAKNPFFWVVKAGYGTLKRRRRGGRAGSGGRRRPRVTAIGPVEPGIYAMVVEFGSHGGRAKQPAQPFMYPALDAARPGHVARMTRVLKEACNAANRGT